MPAGTPEKRAELQRRVLATLSVGQVIGSAATASALTVGAFVIQDLLGAETPWVGLASATATLGSAGMAQVLAQTMRRKGRRVGLQRGYATAATGSLIAAVGVERRLLGVFLLGLVLYGSGQAANLLARYAATDLAEPSERGRAMSRVVFASTFGAVFGPMLVTPAERAGESWFGVSKYTGPWLFAAVLLAGAGLNTALRLRPDPLLVANELGRATGVAPPIRGGALRTMLESPTARVALAAMTISQAVMVGVMSMTPVHMKLHGHETMGLYVVSTHIAGMYAFAPLIGRYADQRGRIRTINVGAVILVGSTVLAALSGDVELLLFPALWGLGIGWNFGLIGGSSLLVDSVPAERRVAVQGTADVLMSLCGGLAGFGSGFVRRAIGYHLLSGGATLLAGVLLVVGASAGFRKLSYTP